MKQSQEVPSWQETGAPNSLFTERTAAFVQKTAMAKTRCRQGNNRPIVATPSEELQIIPRAKREFTSVIRFIDDPSEPYFETTYLELGRGVVGTGVTREDSLRDAELLVVGLLNDILTYEGKLPELHQIPIK